MKYYIDTEFIERGHQYPIELISIGIVAEDDRTYYAILDWNPEHASDWVQDNVIIKIDKRVRSKPRGIVAGDIIDFVSGTKPEFWAYYADYDWVAFCQLFGTMMDLPKGFPRFCMDIKQLCMEVGNPKLPEQDKTEEHHALLDAMHGKRCHEFLIEHKKIMHELYPNV